MKSEIWLILLLLILLPAGSQAFSGDKGGTEAKSLDSLKQYDYAYADMTPMKRKHRRTFARENRDFWLEEVTYPFSTPFTPKWAGKFRNKYMLDKVDLYNYFKGNKAYELVIIKGPNIMHDFSFEVIVYRKIGDEYLAIKSNIEKDRFVEKSYRMMDQEEFSALSATLARLNELTLQQTGDFYFTNPEVLEECLADKSEKADSAEFVCKTELTSGMVIDNTTDSYFLLYGYDGTFDPVHPRKVIYNRMRVEEFEAPFFRDVRWNISYLEGESIAEIY